MGRLVTLSERNQKVIRLAAILSSLSAVSRNTVLNFQAEHYGDSLITKWLLDKHQEAQKLLKERKQALDDAVKHFINACLEQGLSVFDAKARARDAGFTFDRAVGVAIPTRWRACRAHGG